MARRILLLALFCFCALCPARGDDAQGVAEIWRRFVDSLRRGDYAAAHSLFSAESRVVMPYREFVEEYGPLSPARELVLAKTDGRTAKMENNWAELYFDGVLPATGRKFRIGVTLVRNEDGWGLVAARNEQVEHLEAAVRRVMEHAAALREADFAARLRELAAAEPALQFYRLELDHGRLIAEPLVEGLRTFHVGQDGLVRSGRTAPPPPPVAPPPAAPAPPPLVNGFLPELAEPPPPGAFPAMPGELAEPPMPGARTPAASATAVGGAPVLRLPDTIE